MRARDPISIPVCRAGLEDLGALLVEAGNRAALFRRVRITLRGHDDDQRRLVGEVGRRRVGKLALRAGKHQGEQNEQSGHQEIFLAVHPFGAPYASSVTDREFLKEVPREGGDENREDDS